jgi:dihydrofolate reductase
VLTGNKNYKVNGAIIVHTLEELLEEVKKYPSDQVYCIGGDSVYRQLLPYCDVAHITKIDFEYLADTYFPNLDEMPEWEITAESEEQTYFDLEYQFVKYERTR